MAPDRSGRGAKGVAMTRMLTLLILLPGPALAHFGHLGEVAGHDHWVAGAAIGAAALAGLWAAWTDRKAPPAGPDAAPKAEPEAEAEPA